MIRRLCVILAVLAAIQAASYRQKHAEGKRQGVQSSLIQRQWGQQADVVFVLDSSDTVGQENFGKLLKFLQNMVGHWKIGPQYMQVGVVTYGNGATNQIYLNKYSTKAKLVAALGNITFSGGTPDAANAFQFVNQNTFGPLHGARSNVPHIVLHVSNGPSANQAFTLQEAQHMKDNGVIMYNIDVGRGMPSVEMTGAASAPSSKYVFQADTYASLNSLALPLATRLSNEIASGTQSFPTPSGFPDKADIVFMLDSSSSVGQTNFQHLEDFLKDFIMQLPVGQDSVHVGLMQFGGYPLQEFPLGMYTDRSKVLRAIDNLQYMGGGTNTADALKYMREQLFSFDAGARRQVPRIGIIITDGQSSNPTSTISEADKTRLDNIGLIAVGVGSNANVNELHSIANTPASNNTFMVNSYSDLNSVSSDIRSAVRNIRTTAPPMTTVDPSATRPPETCKDSATDCKQYGKHMCVEYAGWAHDNCQRFCGLCQPLYTPPPPPCRDHLTDCANYGVDVCIKFGPWSKDNCMKFCGFCRK